MVAEITTKTAAFFQNARPAEVTSHHAAGHHTQDRRFEQFLNSREANAPGQPDRRPGQPDRPERSERQSQPDRSERQSRSERSDRSDRQDRPAPPSDNNHSSGQDEIAAETPAEEVLAQDAEVAQAAPEAEEMLVETIATELQIPAELVLQVLEELQIRPKDLADPAKANLFLQTVLEKLPAQLLNMPEYPKMVKNLTFIVTEIMQEPLPETLAKLSEALTQLGEFKTSLQDKQLVVELAEKRAETPEQAKPQQLAAPVKTEQQQIQAVSEQPEQAKQQQTAAEAPEQAKQQQTVPENPEQAGTRQTAQSSVTAGYSEPEILPETAPEKPDVPAVSTAIRAEVAALQAANSTNALATPQRADPAQVMEQIMERVKLMPADNSAEIRITLRPESLGEVALRIASRDGIVAAMFVAENMRVKEILESNMNQLRDALEEQGITVSSLNVSVGGESEEQMYQQMRAQQEADRRAAQIAAASASAEELELAEAEQAEIRQRNLVLEGGTVEFAA